MRWKRIPKETASPTAQTSYSGWKSELAIEGEHQCVYCCIHESSFGGERNFHVEHFRPKSLYPALREVYANLFYACSVCNALKGNDWQEPPDPSRASYIDPSQTDLGTHLGLLGLIVIGQTVAARYMIARLALNRPQLLIVRRSQALASRIAQLSEQAQALLGESLPPKQVKAIALALSGLLKSSVVIQQARPYEAHDLQR